MNKEKLNKMKACSHLLPDPGGEVVRECIENIKVLEAENARLKQLVKDTVDGMECLETCDSYGHDDLCPVANPEQAWRQLREENTRLKQEKVELVEVLKIGIAVIKQQCAEMAPVFETCDFCDQWCEVYNWAQKARAAIANCPQSCGHSRSAIVSSDEGTSYCGQCAKTIKAHVKSVGKMKPRIKSEGE